MSGFAMEMPLLTLRGLEKVIGGFGDYGESTSVLLVVSCSQCKFHIISVTHPIYLVV